MPKSKHTRKGVTRKHTNGTFGAKVNGKRCGTKIRHYKTTVRFTA